MFSDGLATIIFKDSEKQAEMQKGISTSLLQTVE